MQSQAQKLGQEQREVFNQEISAFKARLQTAAQTENQLNQKFHQLQESFDTEQRLKATLEKDLQTIEKARDKLDMLHQGALKQIEDAKNENKRPRQLTYQIQANLEHYQQAIQQQQLEQNLEKEQQQAAYAQELSRLNTLLKDAETHKKALAENQFKLEQAQSDNEELKQHHNKGNR